MPTDDYEVTLHRSNWLLDEEVATAKVPVGGQSVDWEPLPPGDYYFTDDAPPHSRLCCLRGDIVVSTFYSPMPMQMPLDPSISRTFPSVTVNAMTANGRPRGATTTPTWTLRSTTAEVARSSKHSYSN